MSDENEDTRANTLEPELQRFADGDTAERLSVLVELDAEPPEIKMGERGWGVPSSRPLAITARDDDATADRLARLRKAVAVIVGKEPVCLEVAEALVADVTAAQLRKIAQLAEVGYIRRNRRHRLG